MDNYPEDQKNRNSEDKKMNKRPKMQKQAMIALQEMAVLNGFKKTVGKT